jgi:methylmalonyl-CoA mutase cobalamin-binding domain/chain
MRIVVGSTDIHEFGLHLVISALEAMGIEPIVAGVDVDPDEFANLVQQNKASAILVSTHNGMALSYAERLLKEMQARGVSAQIVMGGTLNQDFEGEDVPLEVTEQLQRLGVKVCEQVEDIHLALQGVA